MSIRDFTRSNRLHERALRTIPLASQTFSKSSLQYVTGVSPLFVTHGEGCRVWDVDDNEYIDHVLALLPVILGYVDPDVDDAIRAQLERGISFPLATELEVELAERLVELIPCAEMVRFGKNGSDATTAAIRLARAYTGRDRVAVCGYHGWHDWYIGTTTRHLGVPEAVRSLSAAFPYNEPEALERLLAQHPDDFAAIILEPAGHEDPDPGFLERVRHLADRHGALLVFDEIITGFRLDLGGAQAYYGVTPDLAAFGKSLANGMPISAVVGRSEIMHWMERIFFSGTFGGETLSIAAALATIDKLERTGAVARLHGVGARLRREINDVLHTRGLDEVVRIEGPDWWPRIAIDHPELERSIAVSVVRQELIEVGLLAGGGLNLCLAHDDEEVFKAERGAWEAAAERVADAFSGPDPAAALRGHPIEPVFQVRS